MTSERTRNRLARLEAARGQTNQQALPTLADAYAQFGVIIDHRRAAEAGECVYGEGLEPLPLQLMRDHDRFYGQPWPGNRPPAVAPRYRSA